ncbi:MAG: Hsp20/alpha crystallin family protein [Candidatus Falkowbacteria bacterium]|nr:Hsp20/alpha crystallin family protein [Candidatus Falkowbacteria bacterium]
MLKIFKSSEPKNNFVEESPADSSGWSENEQMEGQLAIDVYQTPNKIIIKSTIAGVKPEDLKISLHHDLLSIKGHRQVVGSVSDDDYLFRECYWGNFSRSIILPAEVDSKKIEAILENGILTISLEKVKTEPIRIEVQEEDSD